MDATASSFIETIGQFGPGWFLVIGIVALVALGGRELLKIYSKTNDARLEIERERERRKQEEMHERIAHDREMAEIKGNMSATMADTNVLMSALKTLMEQVVVTNNVLHEDLKASQAGSREMREDVRAISHKVDFIYNREQSV